MMHQQTIDKLMHKLLAPLYILFAMPLPVIWNLERSFTILVWSTWAAVGRLGFTTFGSFVWLLAFVVVLVGWLLMGVQVWWIIWLVSRIVLFHRLTLAFATAHQVGGTRSVGTMKKGVFRKDVAA